MYLTNAMEATAALSNHATTRILGHYIDPRVIALYLIRHKVPATAILPSTSINIFTYYRKVNMEWAFYFESFLNDAGILNDKDNIVLLYK